MPVTQLCIILGFNGDSFSILSFCLKYVVSSSRTLFNPLNPKIKNLNSHLLPIFISYGSSGEKLIKHQANSPCMIMSVILMTTLFYKALKSQGEI